MLVPILQRLSDALLATLLRTHGHRKRSHLLAMWIAGAVLRYPIEQRSGSVVRDSL
jgi:hypothetical protein